MHVRSVDGEERVTPLELFFDLVFVFAITQVTGFLAANETGEGLLRGARFCLPLSVGDVRLADEHRRSKGRRRSTGGLRRSGRHVDRGTRDAGGVRSEAVVFGIAYFLVRALHLVLFAIAGRDDPEPRRAVLRWAPGAVLGPSLLVGASFVDGSAELALWAAALAVYYLSPQVGHGRDGAFRRSTSWSDTG